MTEVGLRIADSPNTLAPATVSPIEQTIDVSYLFAAIRRRRRSIMLLVVVALLLGVGYLATTPKTYVASSTLLLDAGANALVEQLAAIDDRTLSESAIENARLIIQSDPLATMVVQKLALHRNPAFVDPAPSLFARLRTGVVTVIRLPIDLLRPAPPMAADQDAAVAEEQARIQAATTLSRQIGVVRIGRSGAVSIYYKSQDPDLAADIVNAYAQGYIADVLNANFESTERTTEWLQGRLTDLERDAAAAAAEAEAFRTQNGLVSSDGRFMSEESVGELNSDLAAAITEMASSRALVESYQAIVARGVAGLQSGVPGGQGMSASSGLDTLQNNLAEAIANLNRVTANLGADHPTARIMQAEVDTAAQRLFAGLQQRLERARGELSVSEARVSALRDSLREAVGDNAAAGSAQVELRALEQRAETLSMLYQSSLARFQEISQQRDFPISDVRILSTARVPTAADGPRIGRTMGVALVLGLLAGLTFAAIREWADRFLRSGEDISGRLKLPFLGYLPKLEPKGLTRNATLNAGKAIRTETLQGIRLGLDMAQATDSRPGLTLRPAGEVDPVRGVLGITALWPHDGTAILAMDLARTLAAGGATVLLVDANLRQPGLSLSMGFVEGPSLVEVATGRVAWTDVLQKTDLPHLDVVPSVSPPGRGHVAELLSARPTRKMLEEARKRYDYVLVDLAPLGPRVDARVLMRSLGHVLLVAAWGATPKILLRKTVEGDPLLADRLFGVLLDRVDMGALRDYVDGGSPDIDFGAYGTAVPR